MNVIQTLANSDKLEDAGDAAMGKMVFFDLMGHVMVYYPQRLGEILNLAVILAVLLNFSRKLRQIKQQGNIKHALHCTSIPVRTCQSIVRCVHSTRFEMAFSKT